MWGTYIGRIDRDESTATPYFLSSSPSNFSGTRAQTTSSPSPAPSWTPPSRAQAYGDLQRKLFGLLPRSAFIIACSEGILANKRSPARPGAGGGTAPAVGCRCPGARDVLVIMVHAFTSDDRSHQLMSGASAPVQSRRAVHHAAGIAGWTCEVAA